MRHRISKGEASLPALSGALPGQRQLSSLGQLASLRGLTEGDDEFCSEEPLSRYRCRHHSVHYCLTRPHCKCAAPQWRQLWPALHSARCGQQQISGIHAAAHVSSASTRSSCTHSSTCRWSSSQGSSWSGSSSCQSHRHHRRPHYTSLASGDPRYRTLRLGGSARGRRMSLW